MSFKLFVMFILLLFTVEKGFSDDDHEMEEFLKREYSLSKPYQGTPSVQEQSVLHAGAERCFQKGGGLSTSVLDF